MDTWPGKLTNMSVGYPETGGDTGSGHKIINKHYTEEQRWAQPKPIRAHAWAPTVAVSYDLTDNNRLFVRYAYMKSAAFTTTWPMSDRPKRRISALSRNAAAAWKSATTLTSHRTLPGCAKAICA